MNIDLTDMVDDEKDEESFSTMFSSSSTRQLASDKAKQSLDHLASAHQIQLHSVDIDSQVFTSLPEEVKVEVLNYLKQARFDQTREMMRDISMASSSTVRSKPNFIFQTYCSSPIAIFTNLIHFN